MLIFVKSYVILYLRRAPLPNGRRHIPSILRRGSYFFPSVWEGVTLMYVTYEGLFAFTSLLISVALAVLALISYIENKK